MRKVASIDQRKADHIRINLGEDVQSGIKTGLDDFRFIHEALPELNLDSVDATLNLFGKKLNAPVLISSMVGGVKESRMINAHLAEAAQGIGVAMGVGSQRAALENPDLVESFSIVRKTAPDILLFANLGAIQLNNGYDITDCQRAVDMIEADALCLHLNPLQEAVQPGGETNYAGLARMIEKVCRRIQVPVVVKEVGWGISKRTAMLLTDCGVAAIDIAGAGGTSWSQVEMHRASNDYDRQLGASFIDWGIPTSESLQIVSKALPLFPIFASGGLKNGIDIAKCISLGAVLGGMAGPFLRAAVISTEKTISILRIIKRQIEVTMFVCGAGTLLELRNGKIKKKKET
jgi:isopentenyl-diphosphate Delta-isomerase